MTGIADLTERIAAATGIELDTLVLDPAEADTVLRRGGVAAHESGERTNTPLLCHVLGRAVALRTPLGELARLVGGTG